MYEDPNEPIALEFRTSRPFVMVPHWIALADISHLALRLYTALLMHLNMSAGDGLVWPSQQTLADLVGVKKVDTLQPHLKQLYAIGAVMAVQRRYANGMRTRNTYQLTDEPPPGYTGPMSLSEWRKRHDKGVTMTPSTLGRESVDNSGKQTPKNRGTKGKRPGRQVPPWAGVPAPLKTGCGTPAHGGGTKTNETKTNPPLTPPAKVAVDNGPGFGGGKFEDSTKPKPPTPEAVAVVESVPLQLTADETQRLAHRTQLLLDAGWRPKDLTNELTGALPKAVPFPERLLGARLDRIAKLGVPASGAALGRFKRPSWCGECETEVTRTVSVEREGKQTVVRCHRCHPLAVGASANV